MTDTHVLVDIFVVLVAAKLAAEGAERLRLPAVVGEILAGVVLGPSLLGWVGSSELLVTLGEIGVILLLLEVGMEMDLGELRAVGRSALSVAVIGVVVPMVAGVGAARLLGLDGTESLFVGAALTATSVGISARVFGDLRALATVEARTVLGAAVADDVLGLVILTVVVRLAESGSVSATEVGEVVGVAVVFLVVAMVVGLRAVPPVFAAVSRHSRSAGTLVAVAFAFALAVSAVASEARLAPIIGAFVAGLALARSSVAGRVRRELTPISHVFIPIFFLGIGVEAQVDRFVDPQVLAVAGVLGVVAVVGKVVAAAGMGRAPGDRLLVGLGMIPRGEVGLIFATIGLQQGVFDEGMYASVLLVILVTTVATPTLLRARLVAIRRRGRAAGREPGRRDLLVWALSAAAHLRDRPAPPELVDALAGREESPFEWSAEARGHLEDVLVHGGPTAWRFLQVTGVLAAALPDLDAIIRTQSVDPRVVDPVGAWRWPRVERLVEIRRDATPPALPQMLAALALDATGDGDAQDEVEATALIRAIGARVGLDPHAVEVAVAMAGDVFLLEAVCARPWALHDRSLTVLVEHLGSPERLEAVSDLVQAAPLAGDREMGSVIEAVVSAVRNAMAGHEGSALLTAADRRAAAMARVDDPDAERAVAEAPRAHVCTQSVEDLAHQAELVAATREGGGQVRSAVVIDQPTRYRVEVAARDRVGLLAGQARTLTRLGYDIESASTATWPDGTALAAFVVSGPEPPDAGLFDAALDEEIAPVAVADAVVDFDDHSSPWHTTATVEAADRRGLVAAVTAAVAALGLSIHAARLSARDGHARDEFELTGPGRGKLTAGQRAALVEVLATGEVPRRTRRLARRP